LPTCTRCPPTAPCFCLESLFAFVFLGAGRLLLSFPPSSEPFSWQREQTCEACHAAALVCSLRVASLCLVPFILNRRGARLCVPSALHCLCLVPLSLNRVRRSGARVNEWLEHIFLYFWCVRCIFGIGRDLKKLCFWWVTPKQLYFWWVPKIKIYFWWVRCVPDACASADRGKRLGVFV